MTTTQKTCRVPIRIIWKVLFKKKPYNHKLTMQMIAALVGTVDFSSTYTNINVFSKRF